MKKKAGEYNGYVAMNYLVTAKRTYKGSGIILSLFFSVLFCFSGCRSNVDRSSDGEYFKFGAVADIQYADKDQRWSSYYRESLGLLKNAVAHFNELQPSFVIQLGDLIDGHKNDPERSGVDMDMILAEYEKLKVPYYHVIGNYCVYVGIEELKKKLGIDKFYYDFTHEKAEGWRFIVLNGMDGGHGVIGEKQLKWLKDTLQKASDKNERVIIFCHFPLLAEASGRHRMTKPEPVIEVIDKFDNIAGWFAGHHHKGGYAKRKGVHHVTLKAMVEAPENNAYSIIKLYKNKIEITGYGDETDRKLPF